MNTRECANQLLNDLHTERQLIGEAISRGADRLVHIDRAIEALEQLIADPPGALLGRPEPDRPQRGENSAEARPVAPDPPRPRRQQPRARGAIGRPTRRTPP